jgi:hypothetical protein
MLGAHSLLAPRRVPTQMSSPAQKCDLSREELKDDGKKLEDLCPVCKDLGADVKVGFHKARAVAMATPAAGQ